MRYFLCPLLAVLIACTPISLAFAGMASISTGSLQAQLMSDMNEDHCSLLSEHSSQYQSNVISMQSMDHAQNHCQDQCDNCVCCSVAITSKRQLIFDVSSFSPLAILVPMMSIVAGIEIRPPKFSC